MRTVRAFGKRCRVLRSGYHLGMAHGAAGARQVEGIAAIDLRPQSVER
jgi:hypothetical protein